MYTLREWWNLIQGKEPTDDWDGEVFCTETDAALTRRTNETHGFLACYTFTLVTQGNMSIKYNDNVIHLHANDLYIYSPGMAITVTDISPDYKAVCLMVDEHTTLETPAVRDLVSLAYQPIVQFSEPKLSLMPDTAAQLEARMREIISYLYSNKLFKQKILRMLYAVFLFDLQNAQEQVIVHRQIPQRVEDIFIGFNRLLPIHFAAHHDIGFYAEQLNITVDYLSRIVKRVSGRTVMNYINQMLIMEASFLLRNSSLSISQIAQQLHFADTPSFSKFFLRQKGISPRQYRER